MILIALGSNLPHPRLGPPGAVVEAAFGALDEAGLAVIARSRLYDSAPVPASDQPRYVNAVCAVATDMGPRAVLDALLAIEARLGRVRGEPNAARILDLDLLAHGDTVCDEPGLVLPHPRLAERAFVLKPLAEIAPDWRHPVSGARVSEMIAALDDSNAAQPIT